MRIGIDLGTTNSLAAYYNENKPVLIPNRLGEYLTPSVVSLDEDGTIYVGETAQERMAVRPDRTVAVFKRSMGTEKEFLLGDQKFRAEELSSFVLRALKEDAEEYLGCAVDEAIISVPAYFNDVQRKATKKAGELAGLRVERIINEPTAAAIAYGIDHRAEHTKFLVFDLGGGTFDVSILERYQTILEVRAIAGDNFIGGEDFTRILENMMLRKNEIDEASLNGKELAHLRKQAESCKLGFSDSNTSKMKCAFGGRTYETTFSLEEYEQACQMLLVKIRKPIERSLKDAKVKLADVDEIVLVGGATKLPVVRRFVARIFGRIPDTSVNPDEAIAVGAALQCGMKERNETIKEVVLTEVCPFSLGTSVIGDHADSLEASDHFSPIIDRNTVIPVSRSKKFYTAMDFQTKVAIDIIQGESRFAKNNVLLGEITVPVPARRQGEESVEVTYTYDINSLLEVIVKVNSTGVTKKMMIQREGSQISKEEARQRMEELNYLKIHPRDQEENKLMIFRGERLYEEATGEIRQFLGEVMDEFDAILMRQDKGEIEQARSQLNQIFIEIEAEMQNDLFD